MEILNPTESEGSKSKMTTKTMRPRSLSDSGPLKKKAILRKIRKDVRIDQESKLPPFLLTMTTYTISLPPLQNLPTTFYDYLRARLLDTQMMTSLQDAKIINWCRTIKTLYPLSTKGDGNCLLHAASLSMWGLHDSLLILRNMVRLMLTEREAQYKQRWKQDKMELLSRIPGVQLDTKDWDEEWNLVMGAIADQSPGNQGPYPHAFLEEIHIFALSNVLRRPIVILSDNIIRTLQGSTLDANNFPGIYLPLLWKARETIRNPLVLAFDQSHFTPLVGCEESPFEQKMSPLGIDAVPLMTHKFEPLPVHFVHDEERNMDLLSDYMDVTQVNFTTSDAINTVIAARVKYQKLPDDLDLIKDYYQLMERCFISENGAKSEHDMQTRTKPGEFPSSEKQETGLQQQRPETESSPPLHMQDIKKEAETSVVVPTSTTASTSAFHEFSSPQYNVNSACATKGCEFYGSTEWGGYCSRCFLQYTKISHASPEHRKQTLVLRLSGEHRENAAKRASTSAISSATYQQLNQPSNRMSLPPLLFSEQETRPVGPGPSDEAYYSILPRACAEPGCSYYASQSNDPYCYEHAPHNRVGGANTRTTPLGFSAPPTMPLTLRIGSSQSGSQNFNNIRTDPYHSSRFAGQSIQETGEPSVPAENMECHKDHGNKRCIRYDCHRLGHVSQKSMCLEHYQQFLEAERTKQQEEKRVMDTQGLELRNVGKPQSLEENSESSNLKGPSPKRHRSYKSQMSRERCLKPGCVRVGQPKLEGYCSICAFDRNIPDPTSPITEDLKTMDILGLVPPTNGNPKYTQAFSECQNGICQGMVTRDTHPYCAKCYVQLMRSHKIELPSDSGESNERTTNHNDTQVLDPVLTLKCSTIGCQGVRCSGSAGLCAFCYRDQQAGRKPKPNRESTSRLPPGGGERELDPGSPTCTSSSAPPTLLQHKETTAPIAGISPSLSSYEAHAANRKKCIFTACQNEGRHVFNGLCSSCYNTLSSKTVKNKPHIQEKHSHRTPQSHVDPGLDHVSSVVLPEPRRSHLGEPLVRPASHPPGEPLLRPASHPPHRHSVSQACLNRACDRYGDINYDGFCSRCYRAQNEAGRGSLQREQEYIPVKYSTKMSRPPAYAPSPPGGMTKVHHPPSHQYIPAPYHPPSPPSPLSPISPPTAMFGLYLPSQAPPTNREPSPTYTDVVAKIENSSRTSVAKCKSRGCPNYGNSSCQGFCNSCYVKVQASH